MPGKDTGKFGQHLGVSRQIMARGVTLQPVAPMVMVKFDVSPRRAALRIR